MAKPLLEDLLPSDGARTHDLVPPQGGARRRTPSASAAPAPSALPASPASPAPPASPAFDGRMVALFAFCCGAIVGNLYYAQPIIGLIAPDLGLSTRAAGAIVSVTQIGYAIGLFFLVPLGDLLENRRLVMATTLASAASLAAAALVHTPAAFLATSLLVGVTSCAVQMLIPLAAHLAPEASRGRVVGSIMGGLLLGILLSRPVASLVADHFGWRTVFGAAAVAMGAIVVVLAKAVRPHRPAATGASYGTVLRSLFTLLRHQPVLRQRAFYQACLFAAFTLFWTAVPLELAQRHGFSQSKIAVFALVGALGAAAAPLAGRLADAGHTRVATGCALVVAVLCQLPGALGAAAGSFVGMASGVAVLALTGVLLDTAVQTSMVLGQRAIYALDPASRSRLNALYMTSIFLGGAAGATLASVLYAHGGWAWVARAGAALPALAMAWFVIGKRVGR